MARFRVTSEDLSAAREHQSACVSPLCQKGAKALSESKLNARSLQHRCYKNVFKSFIVLATYFCFYILVSQECKEKAYISMKRTWDW